MTDVARLLDQLNHENVQVRMFAATALGKIRDKSVLPALETALLDNSIAVVRSATLAIGMLGGCETISILIRLLEHDALWVRKAAVQALGAANCSDAVPKLVHMLEDQALNSLAREALVALKVDPDFF